ncbi:hypothetical protein D1007_03656 [Hordeum vulgare]|nr:hypothetical protein D1007_03656 [Hordeum vulgare]
MDAPNGNANGSGMCLPRNLLVDVLCRLSPRTLALCRATCHAWRAIVDDHGLLSPHYLPRSVFTDLHLPRWDDGPSFILPPDMVLDPLTWRVQRKSYDP